MERAALLGIGQKGQVLMMGSTQGPKGFGGQDRKTGGSRALPWRRRGAPPSGSGKVTSAKAEDDKFRLEPIGTSNVTTRVQASGTLSALRFPVTSACRFHRKDSV